MSGFEGRTVLITGDGTRHGASLRARPGGAGRPIASAAARAEPIEETAELCRAHGVAALAAPPRRCATPRPSGPGSPRRGAALGPPRRC